MTPEDFEGLGALLGRDDAVITDPAAVERLSKDYYWYSPVLKLRLAEKRGEAVVQPRSVEDVEATLRFAFARSIPVTARGAGTGNYGQVIPLEGGIVLDLSTMDRPCEVTDDGVAICEPGVRLASIEEEARKGGWELRCLPSTWVKSSVGGFLGGGSGGIGSITYGMLRDNGTVRALDVLTMEAEPRRLHFEGDDVLEILHSWGTNGIMTKIWLALGPRRDWAQLAVAFHSFDEAFDAAEGVAKDASLPKRLVTVFEWPIPSYFAPVRRLCPEGKAMLFLQVDNASLNDAVRNVQGAGGEVTFSQGYEANRRGPLLSDYTWNHTTLWALKTDPTLTYLQCGFDPDRAREQFRSLRQRFGGDFIFHIEFVKGEGATRIVPGALPIVRFRDAAYLNAMIDHCRAIGVSVSNPHVNDVEGGGRFHENQIQLLAKHRYDPRGLLNPGKMVTFRPVAAA